MRGMSSGFVVVAFHRANSLRDYVKPKGNYHQVTGMHIKRFQSGHVLEQFMPIKGYEMSPTCDNGLINDGFTRSSPQPQLH